MAGEARLGDVAEIIMGQSPPGETCNTEGIGLPLLNGPTEYGPHHPSPVQFTSDTRKRACPGDILFCVRGSTTGRMNWADREYAIGRGVAAIRHRKHRELQPFVRAVIDYELPGLLAQATGSTFPNVAADQLAAVSWPPHTVPEQRAIAHILGTLDDKIELNRKMNETLEAMARALFKSWFVDFDPVRAKMGGEGANNYSPLPGHIADLFPDSFEDSELGEIPKGWVVGAVEDLADVSSGKRPDARYAEPSELANVPLWGGNGPMAFVTEPLVAFPFLLTGRVGTLGSVFRISAPCWPSDNTLIIKPKQARDLEYLFHQLREIDFMALNRGSTQPLLTQTDIKAQPLVKPTSAVLECYHVFAESLYAPIDESERESSTLETLRDTLLPKLISGEIRVKGAERFVKEK